MKERIREFEKQSGLEIYGLGKDRAKWQDTLEKFAKLIAEDCSLLVENQGRFLTYSAMAKKILDQYGIKK